MLAFLEDGQKIKTILCRAANGIGAEYSGHQPGADGKAQGPDGRNQTDCGATLPVCKARG